MGWILGFGIPIGYLIIGFWLSREVYRSRHKRGHNKSYDTVDTEFTCAFMVVFWPAFAPFYFSIVLGQGNGQGNVFERFYKHNLPESHSAKEQRMREEKYAMRRRIQELERELGVGPKKPQKTYDCDLDCHPYCV